MSRINNPRMLARRVVALFLFLVSIGGVLPSPAMETDQYNLSPIPLADIAPEVEAYVEENIRIAVDKLNADIARREACVNGRVLQEPASGRSSVRKDRGEKKMKCSSVKSEQDKLAQLHSPEAAAKAVYDQLGTGTIFHANTGNWLNTHKFEHEPSRYKAPYSESIYWELPINYATLSPTIRMYGVEFGTDKLDHMFQQGYTYFRKYTAARNQGRSDGEALKKAVKWGGSTENFFYGYVVSGVYSNADLAANTAGLMFYKNLANDVNLAGTMQPAIVSIVHDRWVFNGPRGALRPFITDHLNEAYNPSNYLPILYKVVRSAVKKHACSEWRSVFPTLTRQNLYERTNALTTWNGLDYGYKKTSRQVRLDETCFYDARDPVAAN